MFTGIVQDVGRVQRGVASGGGRLVLGTRLDTGDFQLGESVAVNGVCLTVASHHAGAFEADVSPESLVRTNLGTLRPGDPVNLERALRPNDRLGGHFVLGHVDGVGSLAAVRREGSFRVYRFGAPDAVARYLVEKGSVAVDGVSLTVTRCNPQGFEVALIPHTLQGTRLRDLAVGGTVNLESDILARYVELLLGGRREGPGLTWEQLAQAGFVK